MSSPEPEAEGREPELAELLSEVRALRQIVDQLRTDLPTRLFPPDYAVAVRTPIPSPTYEVLVSPPVQPPLYSVLVRPPVAFPPTYEVAVRPEFPPGLRPDVAGP